MTFGKHKGKPLGDVDRSYFDWLMKQDGFADKNKDLAKWIKEGDEVELQVEGLGVLKNKVVLVGDELE